MDLSACNSAEQESSAESSMSLSPSVRSSTSSRCIFGFIQNVQLATLAVKKRALPTRNISLLSNALIHKQSSPNVSFNGLGTRESCDGLQLDGEINEPTLHSPLSPTAPIEIPNTTVSAINFTVPDCRGANASVVLFTT